MVELSMICSLISHCVPFLILVDGQWGQWNAWGRCSTSCDTGTKMRYRDCVYNGTGPHGADCSGTDQETSFCSINACPGLYTMF